MTAAAGIKAKASEAFAKGRFPKAAELYASYCQLEPKDLQSRLRMGDALAKAGESAKAIAAYASAAEQFARDGFLPRAIAATKLILELDPSHKGTQELLAGLYAQRGLPVGKGRSAAPPPPEPKAPEPPSPDRVADERPAKVLVPPPPFAAGPVPSSPAQSSAAPPGLKPRRSGPKPSIDPGGIPITLEEAPEEPHKAPAAPGKNELRSVASAFDEIDPGPMPSVWAPTVPAQAREPEGSSDSLLHALELAAGAAARADEPQPDGALAAVEPLAGDGAGLPKIPLFSDLPPDAFVALFEQCPLRRYRTGERIIEQGSSGDAFYVVCEGSVRVFRVEQGAQVHLALLKDGAFFGEMALLSGAPRAASVESAEDDTQVLEISAPVLNPLAKRFPSIAHALKKFCRQRLLANLMDTSAFFRPFSRQDRRQLVERFRARDVAPRERLIHEGERSDGLYVVLSGEVEVTQGGNRIATLKEGELFGEMSLLTKTPAHATVTSTRRTSLLRLPREDFDALILSHPQILVLVAELTDKRQKELEGGLADPQVAGADDEPLVLV